MAEAHVNEAMNASMDPQQRRRIRYTATILTVLVLVLYFGYILYAVLKAHH